MAPQEIASITLDGCISPHVAMARRDHVRLEWLSSGLGLDRTRPVTWTCACRATVYELCAGGGRAYLRRTVQLDGGPQVHQTRPSSVSEVWALWTDLMSGAAR